MASIEKDGCPIGLSANPERNFFLWGMHVHVYVIERGPRSWNSYQQISYTLKCPLQNHLPRNVVTLYGSH